MQYDQREDLYNAEKSKIPVGSEPIPDHLQKAKASLTADWKIGKAVQKPADLQWCASGTMQSTPMAPTPSGGSKSATIKDLEGRRSIHLENRAQFHKAMDRESDIIRKLETAINILTLHPEAEVIVELLQLGIVL